MAIMIPENVNSISENATIGEKRVFKVLQEFLPDSYSVWFNIRVKDYYPDYIILAPELGIIVLEVKDWNLSSITSANKNTFQLFNSETQNNPLVQARNYMLKIKKELELEESLTQRKPEYEGKLKFPYFYGVVFTNINSSSYCDHELCNAIENDYIIFEDDLDKIEQAKDTQYLMGKFNLMNKHSFIFDEITKDDIEKISNIIYREITPNLEDKNYELINKLFNEIVEVKLELKNINNVFENQKALMDNIINTLHNQKYQIIPIQETHNIAIDNDESKNELEEK